MDGRAYISNLVEFCILARPPQTGCQALFDGSPETGSIHGFHHGGGGSAGRGGLVEQGIERNFTLTPRDDSVGQGVCRRGERGLAVQAEFLGRRPRERRVRDIRGWMSRSR